MFRTNARRQENLFDRAQTLKGYHRDWVLQGLAATSLLAPRARCKDSKDAMSKLLWTVLQILFFGEREITPKDREDFSSWEFTDEDFLAQLAEVDSILISALKEFHVARLVIPTLDIIQASEDTLLTAEAWPEIREWLVKELE